MKKVLLVGMMLLNFSSYGMLVPRSSSINFVPMGSTSSILDAPIVFNQRQPTVSPPLIIKYADFRLLDQSHAEITWFHGRNTDEGFLTEKTSESVSSIEKIPTGYMHCIFGGFSLVEYLITADTPEMGKMTLVDKYTFDDQKISHQFTKPVLKSGYGSTDTNKFVRDRFIEVDGKRIVIASDEVVDPPAESAIVPVAKQGDKSHGHQKYRNYKRFDGKNLKNIKIKLADHYAEQLSPPISPQHLSFVDKLWIFHCNTLRKALTKMKEMSDMCDRNGIAYYLLEEGVEKIQLRRGGLGIFYVDFLGTIERLNCAVNLRNNLYPGRINFLLNNLDEGEPGATIWKISKGTWAIKSTDPKGNIVTTTFSI